MKKRQFLQLATASIIVPKHAFAGEGIEYATGNFTSGVTKGLVCINQHGLEWFVEFRDNFVHEGSPDPWVALGKDGYQRSGLVAELKQFKGAQRHIINPKIDPRQFNEVYVWCEQHNTSLGRARLNWTKP